MQNLKGLWGGLIPPKPKAGTTDQPRRQAGREA